MRVNGFRFFFSALTLISMGCTKGVPDFEALDSANVPQPIFDNSQTAKTIQVRTGSETPSVQGSCDHKIRAIVAQIMDVDEKPGSIDNVATAPAAVTCTSDSKFSLTLKGLSSLGYGLVEGKVYEVQFRAVTTAGLSRASALRIRYSTSNGSGPNRILISSGGTMSKPGPRVVSSTNYKAIISVGHRSPAPAAVDASSDMQVNVSSGGSFKARIGASAAAN